MALVPDQKFSTFQNGGDLIVGDIVVGLRNGLNTRFEYTGLPVGAIIPISQGGTGATTASGARTNLGLGTIATQDSDAVAITGGTIADVVVPTPAIDTDIANKAYVDAVATGLNIQPEVVATSTANLTATYDNAASGVGATLTNSGALAALTLDGVALSLNDRVLIPFQTTTTQNGIYTVTVVGDGATAWVLTRATDFDTPGEIEPGDLVVVIDGTVYANTSFLQTETVATIGSDPIVFVQFTASASNVVTLTGSQTITGQKTFVAPILGAATGTSLNLGATTTIAGMIDDDSFATASASLAASSESIKAYIDNTTKGLASSQIFTSSGTWNRPSGVTKIVIEVVSGGGGGGSATTDNTIGAGGGGGGYGKKFIDVSAISSVTVTIGAAGASGTGSDGGAGGTSSFGAHVSVTGGGGGVLNGITNIATGGASTGGDINNEGQRSPRGGSSTYAVTGIAGDGASGIYGAGGRRGVAGGGGAAGNGYGAGGGGGYRDTSTTRNGGAGSAGIVIVYEYK